MDSYVSFRSSPEYVKTSLASSISLGMEPGRFTRGKGCTCLNILLNYEEGCLANCGYCGLAANRRIGTTGKPSFIRVRWPVYSLESIISKLKEGRHPFKRICVSMVAHPSAADDCRTIISSIASQLDIPVSALLTPAYLDGEAGMRLIKSSGADRVGIAIDAATEALFDSLRGKGVGGPHRWERYLESVDEAVIVFGKYNAGVHLIVGIGETEKEMAKTIEFFHTKGAVTHLFSFYPEHGSMLETHERPSLGRYRRMQLARYLINMSICRVSDFTFSDDGRLIDFGVDVAPLIERGVPFMTSGCPGKDGVTACNRPFSNERPSEPIRNFHFMPDATDKGDITAQIFEDI